MKGSRLKALEAVQNAKPTLKKGCSRSNNILGNLGDDQDGDPIVVNPVGVRWAQTLVRCIRDPMQCRWYSLTGGRPAQKGWVSAAHMKTDYPKYFDGRGVVGHSLLNDLTERQWKLLGLPFLFWRPLSLVHNVVQDHTDLEVLLPEPGTKRRELTHKLVTKDYEDDTSTTTATTTTSKAKGTISRKTKPKVGPIMMPVTPPRKQKTPLAPSSGNFTSVNKGKVATPAQAERKQRKGVSKQKHKANRPHLVRLHPNPQSDRSPKRTMTTIRTKTPIAPQPWRPEPPHSSEEKIKTVLR